MMSSRKAASYEPSDISSPAPPEPGGTRTSLEYILLSAPSTPLLKLIPQKLTMPGGLNRDVKSFHQSKGRIKIQKKTHPPAGPQGLGYSRIQKFEHCPFHCK